MTYGYFPEDWPTFRAELAEHGIPVADIETVTLRPEAPAETRVTITLRSGRTEEWLHRTQEASAASRPDF